MFFLRFLWVLIMNVSVDVHFKVHKVKFKFAQKKTKICRKIAQKKETFLAHFSKSAQKNSKFLDTLF